MNLKIGKENFEVDRIIYISPTGSDKNDGLSKKSPLLTLKHAIEYIVSLGGGAINFMVGIHDFTDQCLYQTDNSNNAFIIDSNVLSYFATNNSVPIIFYSEYPTQTEIHLIKTYTKGYNRTQFISLMNKDSKLINLNLFFKCNVATGENYDAVFTFGPTNSLITNCIFNIDVENWSSIPMRVSLHSGTCTFNNCIFNTGETIKNLTTSCTYNNCIFQTSNISGTINNKLIEPNLNTLTIQELINLKDNNGKDIGVANSDYSMWKNVYLNKILLQKILSLNLNTLKLDKETLNLIFTETKDLYITNALNELIKLTHNHNNINTLNKFSIQDNALYYNDKFIKPKDILTEDDEFNIICKVFNIDVVKQICDLSGIDSTLYTSINDLLQNENSRNAIVNSEKTIDYIFNNNSVGKYIMKEFIKNSDMFSLICENEYVMNKLCASQKAREIMYNNYQITESIIANSTNAMTVMMNSSRFEKVSHSMTTEFSNLYNGKAFVFGISQEWHNGTTRVINTHGHYINIEGNTISEISSTSVDQGSDGLKYRVNKFADYVCQKNSYGNNSTCHAAIFKI